MKTLVSILFFFTGIAAAAQDHPTFKRAIKVNPIFIAAGEINLAYEQVLSNNSTIDLQGGYFFYDLLVGRGEDATYPFPTDASGVAVRLTYKAFFQKSAPLGYYLAGQAMYKGVSFDSLNASFQAGREFYNLEKQVLGLKLLIGKQISLAQSRILFDFYAGLGVKRNMKFYNIYLKENWRDNSITAYNHLEKRIIPSIHLGVTIGIGL